MREAVIQVQRTEHGRKAVAVLPIHYPKPLLTAMDILAVELWGPPGPPRGAGAGRVQTYVCALVRNAMAFLSSGGADRVDGVLFPHTCDSIQGLATLVPEWGGLKVPSLRYLAPKGDRRDATSRFARRELESLANQLADLTGQPLDSGRLATSVLLHQEIDTMRRRLLEERARVPLTDPELYALLRRGEFLWPADHAKELRDATDTIEAAPVQRGVPIMVTGYVPEPASSLEALREAGAYIVADDYAAIGRRVPRSATVAAGDPLDALTERMFAGPPCPTVGGSQARRLDYLQNLYEDSGAAGVVVHTLKFCEPELFDVPAIEARFERLGAPVLHLEGELELELSGQTITRIEAFVEMVQNARRVA
jgi:benzoyl-CoA reductase/2-hydroxyglutaryl-CoA dehydratase subunit BcrC/BadD/HgdB